MATCKGCGAPIVFVKLKSGKAIPCNPSPVFIEDKAGREIIVTVDGRISNGRQEHVKCQNQSAVRGYVSHFATCPKSTTFRKRGS